MFGFDSSAVDDDDEIWITTKTTSGSSKWVTIFQKPEKKSDNQNSGSGILQRKKQNPKQR